MTNEEAIKEIQDASDYEVRHGDIEHHHEDIMRRVEAFEKAVNALQKEPCEDAVSRQAVITIIKDWWEKGAIAIDDIRKLPSVTPTSKASEWQQDHAILKAHSDGANEVIDRVRQAREEIANYSDYHRQNMWKANPLYDVEQGRYLAYEKCLSLLDKLIAEVEGTSGTNKRG